ncbi:hypothetical protein F5X99DRAFT_383973 [Biscogniauxia marginata]|nr:hypothetical protein F5X99DRAFT_383973 [Biscogniauxia marginata]
MWGYLRSLVTPGQPPAAAALPSPVTIRGIRYPADGSAPHVLPLTTTTHGVADGPDCPWGHVPDLRGFWKTPQAWRWRDIETFRLANQPLSHCDGLYVLFFSFDLESLLAHHNAPRAVLSPEVEQRTFAGDAFVVKLQGNEIGEDLGEDGWAAWVDVPLDILSLPIMKT